MTKAVSYSPSNELTAAVIEHVAEAIDGPRPGMLSIRWRVDGTMIYVQSASGSNLAYVDFARGEIRYTDRIPKVAGRVDELPEEWRPEFMGFTREGDYADEATRQRMNERYAQKREASRKAEEQYRQEREARRNA